MVLPSDEINFGMKGTVDIINNKCLISLNLCIMNAEIIELNYCIFPGYCLYGDDPRCTFQCHCAVDSECSTGICPSGCDKAPLGHNWRGPGCQIGKL